jgi:dolichol kinase
MPVLTAFDGCYFFLLRSWKVNLKTYVRKLISHETWRFARIMENCSTRCKFNLFWISGVALVTVLDQEGTNFVLKERPILA